MDRAKDPSLLEIILDAWTGTTSFSSNCLWRCRLLLNRKPRIAACSVAAVMVLLTAVLYLPLLALTRDPSEMTDAINFVADTLMFGGILLLVARAAAG